MPSVIAQTYAVMLHLLETAKDREKEIQTLKNSLEADLAFEFK